MSNTHNPPLSGLIDASAVPGDIAFLEDNAQAAIDAVLGKIFYKDLRTNASSSGDAVTYNITLLSTGLRIPLFSTGLELVFFKGATADSEFPIEFQWRWGIRKYIAGFESQGFSYAPEAFIEILFALAGISDFEEFVGEIISIFLDTGNDDYLAFFDDVEATLESYKDGTAADDKIDEITDQLQVIKEEVERLLTTSNLYTIKDVFDDHQNNAVIRPAVENIINSVQELADTFNIYVDLYSDLVKVILGSFSDLDTKFEKLLKLFEKWLGNISLENVKKLLVPQFSVALTDINMALDFPREYLLPMKEVGGNWEIETDVTKKAGIIFKAGSIQYSTETGFNVTINESASIGLPRCMIPNLGLQLEFINIKLDLSRSSNIAEATADGRPEDFIGAYIQEANIWLPDQWFEFDEDGSTLQLYAKDMIVGTGGLSGTIGVKAAAGLDARLSASMLLSDGRTVSLAAGSDGVVNEGDTATISGSPIEDGRFLLKDGGTLITEDGKLKQFLSSDGELSFKLGKSGGNGQWEIGFSQFYLKFWQNKIQESEIKGFLTIPNFKQEGRTENLRIDVSVFFEDDGDFRITAAPKDGLTICLGENGSVLKIKIKGLAAGKDEEKLYLEVSGTIDFSNNTLLSSFMSKPIEVKKLRIYSDGSFEIEGGSIPIPGSIHLNLGPVEVDVTNITLGAETLDKGPYKFIGFDCGMSTGAGGLDLRGDGIKIYFNRDGSDMFLRIAGIGIDLVIPGTASEETAALILKGYLSIREDEFVGAVAFKLPSMNIAGGAAMKIKPEVPAFAVDAFLELSAPIPLGQTGLGIFGFRGLFGLRYIADLPEGATSDPDKLFDFYTEKKGNPLNSNTPEKGLHLGKIVTPEQRSDGFKTSSTPISIGAGISLGTAVDAGRAFSMQAFLFLSLPELLMISGRGNVLGERVSIVSETEPPFFAYMVFTSSFVSIGLGAEYKVREKEGEFLELNAEAQLAFFFNDFSAWYVHFGTKEEPNTAKVLKKIFKLDAYAYLMLSAAGIEAGAGVKLDMSKHYGPVKVTINAYGDVYAMISFRKPQVGGGIAMGGNIGASVFGIGFNFGIDAYLMATIPTPFIVKGGARICLEVDLWITTWRKCIGIDFKWTFDESQDASEIKIIDTVPFPVSAIHIPSQNTYKLSYFRSVQVDPETAVIETIPLDSYIDIQFKKPVDPRAVSAKIGGSNAPPLGSDTESIPPKEVEKQVIHRFEIMDVVLKAWDGSHWQDYHPYEALSNSSYLDTVTATSEIKIGAWQLKGNPYNNLRLLAATPLDFTNGLPSNPVPEKFGVTASTLFCRQEEIRCHCIQWTAYQLCESGRWYNNQAVKFKVTKHNADVVNFSNVFHIVQSLHFHNQSRLELIFPEKVLKASLKLFSYAKKVKVSYYDLQDVKVMQHGRETNRARYVLVKEVFLGPADYAAPVKYEDDDQTIKKISIEAEHPGEKVLVDMQSRLTELELQVLEGNDKAKGEYAELSRELKRLQSVTCDMDSPGESSGSQQIKDRIQVLEQQKKKLLNVLKELKNQKEEKCGPLQQFTSARDKYRLHAEKAKFFLMKWLYTFIAWLILVYIKLSGAKKLCDKYTSAYNKIADQLKAINEELKKLEEQLAAETAKADKCSLYLHEVCYLTRSEYWYNKSIPSQEALDADYDSMNEAISKVIAPIWRPDQFYSIEVKTKETVIISSDTDPDPVYERSHFFAFKTAGPIGHFPLGNLPDEKKTELGLGPDGMPLSASESFDKKTEVPENALKYYIDFNRSYPNPIGNIINQKPLYYEDPNLLIFYTESYVYNFFSNWPVYNSLQERYSEMKIEIKDPVENSVSDDTAALIPSLLTVFPAALLNWQTDPNPLVKKGLELINNMRDPRIKNPSFAGATCWTIGGEPIKPASRNTVITAQNLKPSKLYNAIIFNRYSKDGKTYTNSQIHSYPFQTSRYANLPEQVNSYHMNVYDFNTGAVLSTKDAVYELAVDLSMLDVSIAQLNNVTNGNDVTAAFNPALIQEYPDAFRRLLYGYLQLDPLHPVTNTEFNLLKNENGKLLGILIRNPEPFNDPRIPLADLKNSIQIAINGTLITSAYTLFSNDRSEVYVLNPDADTFITELNVTFSYLLWDGNAYTQAQTITTDNLL